MDAVIKSKRTTDRLHHPSQVESQAEPCSCSSGVLYVGGNANSNGSNSVQYGLSYANANNDLSNSNSNIGSRLNFEKNELIVIPTLPYGRTLESIKPVSVAQIVKTRTINKGIMRHRLRDCYSRICTMPVLEKALRDACRPRVGTKEVAEIRANQDVLLKELQQNLRNHTLEPLVFNIYTKKERGKDRLIADHGIYPWRIVECAIAIVIEDDLNRKLIRQTHASIKGRGTHSAMMNMRRHLYNDPKIRYILCLDIAKCYGSIPSSRMKLTLRDYIKDPELLHLMDSIIDAYNRTGYSGIALGGRLSPLMANLYLNRLDHHIKENLHVHYFERYMDNYFIMGYSKPWLHKIQEDIAVELGELGLALNRSSGIRPIDSTHGVDVLGWVMYSDHVLIRKKTKERMRRTFRHVMEKMDRNEELDRHDMGSIRSYSGSFRWFDSYNLRRKIADPVLNRISDNERWAKGTASFRSYIKMNKEVYN